MISTPMPSHSNMSSELNALSSAVRQINNDESIFTSDARVWAKRLVAPLSSLLAAVAIGYCSLVIAAMTAGLSIIMMAAGATVVYAGVSLAKRLVTKSPGSRLLSPMAELEESGCNASKAYKVQQDRAVNLQEQLNKASDENRGHQARVERQEAMLKQLGTELQRQKESRDVLTAELNQQQNATRHYTRHYKSLVGQLQAQLDQARGEIQKENENIAALRAELDQAKNKTRCQQNLAGELQESLSSSEQRVQDQKSRADKLQEELEQARTGIRNHKANIDAKIRELDQAKNETRSQQNHVVQLQGSLSSAKKRAQDQEFRAVSLQEELKKAREDIQKLELNVDALKVQCKTLTDEAWRHQDRAGQLQRKVDLADRKAVNQELRASELQQELGLVCQELESQKVKVAELDQTLKQAYSENQIIQARADKLEKRCKESEEAGNHSVKADISAQTEIIPGTDAEAQCAAEIVMDAKDEKAISQKTVVIKGKTRTVLDDHHRPGQRVELPVAEGDDALNAKQREDLEYRWVPEERIAEKLENALGRAIAQQNDEKPKLYKRKATDFLEKKDVHKKFNGQQNAQGKVDLARSGEVVISVDFKESDTLPDTGVACSPGVRKSMEDQDIHKAFNLEVNGVSYPVKVTGVFDGHKLENVLQDGALWAKHGREQLLGYLQRRLEAFSGNGLSEESIFNALKLSFVDLAVSWQTDKKALLQTGTTANIVLCFNGALWCANIGDSRAILVDSDGEALQISEDAKPDMCHYRSSIEKRDGSVKENHGAFRINNKLAPGRTLGDFDLGPGISPRPKLTRIPEDQYRGKWLIQVCDGVTDVATTNQIGQMAAELLAAGNSPAATAAKLVASAIKAGSKDNLTVIIRQL